MGSLRHTLDIEPMSARNRLPEVSTYLPTPYGAQPLKFKAGTHMPQMMRLVGGWRIVL